MNHPLLIHHDGAMVAFVMNPHESTAKEPDTSMAIPPKTSELAKKLREYREWSGLRGRPFAKLIGISQAKVSRIESGQAVPTKPEVRKWAEATGASPERLAQLLELTEAAHDEKTAWRDHLQARGHHQFDVAELEQSARLVHSYHAAAIPGLLQVAGYAHRVFTMTHLPYDDEELGAAVAARLRRQNVLYDPDRHFEFLLAEAVLRWQPGPVTLMLAQLHHVKSISTLENVSLGVIPLDQELNVPLYHSFSCYGQGDGDPNVMVEVETIHTNIRVTEPDEVAIYRDRWSALTQAGVFGDEARELIDSLIAQLRARET
jgi:transcriptional regulator with XRE-family HTH domain